MMHATRLHHSLGTLVKTIPSNVSILKNQCACQKEKFVAVMNSMLLGQIGKPVCHVSINFIQECRETTQCTPLNSACVFDRNENTSFCLCSVGEYIESEKTPGKCLKIQNELRLPCEEEQQCVSGLGILSECRDGFCFCRYNYAYYDGYCYTPAKLTERCYVDGECHAGVNNYTFCNPSDMRCRCLPGAIVHDNTCYATKYVGDLCNSNVECALSILGNVICDSSTNRCTCFRGYSAEYGNSVCSSASLPQLISNTVAAALMFSVFIFQ
ncbi:hypothetical protein Ocin01_14164 [Orchesella cincta]|uniref:EB domain-containing protein n=1 Tax=Orchesella cincta TaxID=48709 RepID=A0A1D2MHM9_ORCCI|nr:hypothetical protein Ocin01_14164 [Orchesella cincta]